MLELINPINLSLLAIGLVIAYWLARWIAPEPSRGIYLIAFFLPFERIPSLELAGFTFKINHFLGILTFALWLGALLVAKRKLMPHPFTWLIGTLFFSFVISGLGAENSFRQLTVMISLGLMAILHFVTIGNIRSSVDLKMISRLILISAGLMSLIGLYQFFGDLAGLPLGVTGLDPGYAQGVFGFPRVHSFSKEPLYYANYLFIPLGIVASLLLADRQGKRRGQNSAVATISTTSTKEFSIESILPYPWLVAILSLIGINFVLTLSRGAYLAAVPFALTLLAIYFRQFFTWRNLLATALVSMVVLATSYQIVNSVSPESLEKFIDHATLGDVLRTKTGESGFGRLNAFEQALGAWQDRPIFGIGLGNFGPHILAYPEVKPDRGWEIVNNEYLELLAESGLVGLGLWLSLCLAVIGRSVIAYHRASDPLAKIMVAGLQAAWVGILVQYNFFSTLYIIHIWVVMALLIASQNIALASHQPTEVKKTLTEKS